MKIIPLILLGLLLAPITEAETCYFTLVKDSCWANYNVSVDVLDSNKGQVLTTVTAPKGKQWGRESFTCSAQQKLNYSARFAPVFWQSDVGKTYAAKEYISLPAALTTGQTAWTLSACYPSDFSLVPLPPDASGNCQCDYKTVPAVPTQHLP